MENRVRVTFAPAKGGGVMAKVWGRVAFPDRQWGRHAPPPQAGEEWEVTISGENPQKTVYFLLPVRCLLSAEEIAAKEAAEKATAEKAAAERAARQRAALELCKAAGFDLTADLAEELAALLRKDPDRVRRVIEVVSDVFPSLDDAARWVVINAWRQDLEEAARALIAREERVRQFAAGCAPLTPQEVRKWLERGILPTVVRFEGEADGPIRLGVEDRWAFFVSPYSLGDTLSCGAYELATGRVPPKGFWDIVWPDLGQDLEEIKPVLAQWEPDYSQDQWKEWSWQGRALRLWGRTALGLVVVEGSSPPLPLRGARAEEEIEKMLQEHLVRKRREALLERIHALAEGLGGFPKPWEKENVRRVVVGGKEFVFQTDADYDTGLSVPDVGDWDSPRLRPFTIRENRGWYVQHYINGVRLGTADAEMLEALAQELEQALLWGAG